MLTNQSLGMYLCGIFFGYPPCCVDFFTREWLQDRLGRMELEAPSLLNGSGFIACPVCAATYTDEEMIDIINKARDSSLPPFPYAGDPDPYMKLFNDWMDRQLGEIAQR